MKTLERGFKAWAERTSASLRRELDVQIDQPLRPVDLADYLGVRLLTPSDVPNVTSDVLQQLLKVDRFGWSAVGLESTDSALVIYNPSMSVGRQASDVTHELSHFILGHRPATIIFSESLDLGMRSFDQKQEDEANCLAWTLLLPRVSLVWSESEGLEVNEIASTFGVTTTLVTFRQNTTGIKNQFAFRRKGPARPRSRKAPRAKV